MLATCVSGPAPKVPDESHRVPVNQVVPPEVAPDGASEKEAGKAKAHGDGAKVEWR
jgi:hypothetical protein